MTAGSDQKQSGRGDRRHLARAAAWVVTPVAACLGFAWWFELGESGAAVAALGLAVLAPMLGAAIACERFVFETRLASGARRSGSGADWVRGVAPLVGLGIAGLALSAGSVSAAQGLTLMGSYWLLAAGGWGLAMGLAAVGMGRVLAVMLVGATVAAGSFTPFYTDRMVNRHPVEERAELRGMLAGFSPVLTLAAEVFGEQMLKKDVIYLKLQPGMSGMDLHRSPAWFGGWRLGAWFGIVVGVVAVAARRRRAGVGENGSSASDVESAGR